jgi:hypothetical protein
VEARARRRHRHTAAVRQWQCRSGRAQSDEHLCADARIQPKCAFTVYLDIYSKTTDGDDLDFDWISDSASFALEIGST